MIDLVYILMFCHFCGIVNLLFFFVGLLCSKIFYNFAVDIWNFVAGNQIHVC